MSYLKAWQNAKKAFEAATGKKKPSESFLGVFRKSSGMESACKALDDQLKKPTLDGLNKALMNFDKARTEYVKLLQKADVADKGGDYGREIATLQNVLEGIQQDFAKEMQDALQNSPRPLTDILGKYFKDLTTPVLTTKASVKWFATDKALKLSGATGKPLPAAASAIDNFKTEIQAYAKQLAEVKKQGKTLFKNRDGIKFAADAAEEALAHIFTPGEGALPAFRIWVAEQQESFKKAKNPAGMKEFIESGPLAAKLKKLGDDLNDEMVRMNNLAADIRKLAR